MTLVYTAISENQILFLLEKGFSLDSLKSQYEVARYRKYGVTIVLYTSGKLVVQSRDENGIRRILDGKLGKPKDAKLSNKENVTCNSLENNFDQHYSQNIIGSDEALKGDSFGGIVTVGFYVSESIIDDLRNIGVDDSKKITDEKIQFIASILESKYPNNFVVEELDPISYNDETAIHNVTFILNKQHGNVGKILKTRFGDVKHIVDQYPGCRAGDSSETKAESRYVAVAAASIIARNRGLKQFERLSHKIGFTLPKGSTHVRGILAKLRDEGYNMREYCKLHFKNVAEYLR